jgi:hypothetical protein
MNKKKIALCFGYLLIMGIPLFPQPLKLQVAQAMDQVRKGKFYNGSEEPFAKNLNGAPEALIDAICPYITDTFPRVRLQATDIIYLASHSSTNKDLKQKAVQYIMIVCGDKESGNAGRAGSYLMQYNREDFNTTAKDSLLSYIKRRVYYLDNILMLAGYLNLSNVITDINLILADKKYSDKIKWTAHLALSRMGNNSDTEYCIRLVKSKTMSDAIVYNLLPGLIYTRQKAAFNYLITILNNKEKNCTSRNPESNLKIPCGYRVMEFLAPVIKDFPLQLIEGLDQIKTDNYDTALETARKWFKVKGENYEIKNDSF